VAGKLKRGIGFGWLELAIVGGIVLCVATLGYRISSPPPEITILDRPRNEATSPDFLIRYLDATNTEYHVENGFLVLPVTNVTRERLRGLLSGLGTYIDLLQDDRHALVAKQTDSATEVPTAPAMIDRRTAEPTPDGRLNVVTHSVSWSADTWQEFDQLLSSLESQYCEVAEALEKIDRGIIVPRRFTPAEPVFAGRPLERAITAKKHSEKDSDDVIELIEVAAPTGSSLPSANQNRSLGN
jgi:hypothetical protein